MLVVGKDMMVDDVGVVQVRETKEGLFKRSLGFFVLLLCEMELLLRSPNKQRLLKNLAAPASLCSKTNEEQKTEPKNLRSSNEKRRLCFLSLLLFEAQ